MNLAPIYIIRRFFYYVLNFFHHWYFHASKVVGHYFLTALERADKVFAIKITLRYLFQPLYKDYSFVGRILGFFFRSCRILIGLIAYVLMGSIFLILYLAWLVLPLALIFNVISKI